ncbi:threonine synthase [Citrifermentans bremense]|uniref:threonine synthase n=1 Tax=Citrifermentans bremense TaxID=60035 RepID=UPI0004157191|nr:threonine synthase [Citrifermentans bremense]
MKYISTRGKIAPVGFKDAVMMGLATDGGLILPESIPQLDRSTLAAWSKLPYRELAFNVISLFATDIPAFDLKALIDRSYGSFEHEETTPLVQKDGVYILELFHGPTLAFKDVALQLLGNLFEYLLKERGEKMNILGATSGDTGSAAIAGVRGKENINIFILHPHLKTSPIQALQMTSVLDENVHNVAVEGTFDDCQNIVKTLFNDLQFKKEYALGAVNSINWARVLAQVVYYFYAWGRLPEQKEVIFSVPTGNFGDIFAGYLAKRMGLPVEKLLLATNENNILARFVQTGDYSLGKVVQTVSPSMDIQLASNLERYLYYLWDENPEKVCSAFAELQSTGRIAFTKEQVLRVQAEFMSCTVDEQKTLDTIASFNRETGYLLDPHTAVGVRGALECAPGHPRVVCLATAHPAKFGDAVERAVGSPPPLPPALAALVGKETRCELMAPDQEKIKAFVKAKA